MHGISQNPHTKDYIIVFNDKYFESYCLTCNKRYIDCHQWCKPCQTNYLKENYVNWTSGNEEIDNFIQETQLNINNYDDTLIEWIPYDKFDDFKETAKYDFATVYSAKWKDGPLEYNKNITKYERNPNKAIILKCLYNVQNVNEFVNKV
jgi:hypothetical protein